MNIGRMDLLRHVLYINLEKRPNRRAAIEAELSGMGLHGERIAGLDTAPYGYIGCAYAHITALRTARERNWSHVLILEDDFQFVVNRNTLGGLLERVVKHDFDVLLLAYNLRHSDRVDEFISRTEHSFTASGYLVARHYYDTLIQKFEESLANLVCMRNPESHAIDVAWRRLQARDRWLHFHTRVGIQRPGFSDIELRSVNYNV